MDPGSYYDTCPNSGDICGGSWANLMSAINSGTTPQSLDSTALPSPPDTGSPGLGSLVPTYPVACMDGTLSYSGGQQGACSHHGGESG